MNRLRIVLFPALVMIMMVALSCSESTTPPGDDPPAVGDIDTWAGTGHAGYNGENKDRLSANLYWPNDIEFTASIGTFITDWNNHRVRQVDASGKLVTVVGTPSIGDGPPAPNVGADIIPPGVDGTDCDLNHPTQVFQRQNGRLVIVCWHNHKLREWDPATGLVTVLAGRGGGCTGEGLLVSDPLVRLNQVASAIEGPDGSIYINDQRNQCIRKISPAGVFTTVVAPVVCNLAAGSYSGDGGSPLAAKINMPTGPNPNPPGGGLALDAQGRLYISDTLNHRIRRVDFGADVITTVVGNGVAAFGGDGGDPTLASLNTPIDICFGPDGRLYIADTFNNRVRAVDFTSNVITTIAGTGIKGYTGDGGPATEARLAWPYGVAFDADGHLFISDTYNHRIRRVKMHD